MVRGRCRGSGQSRVLPCLWHLSSCPRKSGTQTSSPVAPAEPARLVGGAPRGRQGWQESHCHGCEGKTKQCNQDTP